MDFSFLVLAAAIWKIRVLALFFRPLCLFRIQPLEYVGALGLSCPWPGLYSPTNPIPIAPFASGLLAGILSAGKLLAPFCTTGKAANICTMGRYRTNQND